MTTIKVNAVCKALFACMLLFGFTWSREVIIGPCILILEDPGDCPDERYINIYLFTRKNKEVGQYVTVASDHDNITASHFNANHTNKLIIHGYNSDMNLDALMNIKSEWLEQSEFNVWMVNYPRLAEGGACYPFAVHNIRHVGRCLAQLIGAVRRRAAGAHTHVLGFSLGAHVANYLANALNGPKLDRITGLDPAGPLFTTRHERHRLDPSDANFVDVVHTNALIQGIVERSGHIDFYMNGGVNQPGCMETSNPLSCDHHRAPKYFAESIRSKVGFLGWECEGYLEYLTGECLPKIHLVPMGEHCSPGNTGFYVTYTASEEPFALGNWTKRTFWQKSPKMSFTRTPKNSSTTLESKSMVV